jgi:uncharacterized protein YPO0396
MHWSSNLKKLRRRQAMKKLTKTLLIHWLYYDKLVLDFSDINYMVGKNASGKSTFIDALMIVLLGEVNSRNFNKAANESARRSIKQYLRADMDPRNPESRKGRSFNTYIACEFLDTVTGERFTAGIVFDCNDDGSERYNYFTFDGEIPEDCFIVDRKPMDISQLRIRLKELYKSRQEIYDSNKRYKSAIKAKWNIHVDQVFSALKQGAFFKPIDDIRVFITENVCDVQQKLDIVAMQQNIEDYKHQEKLAARQEYKLTRLLNIRELYRKNKRAQDLLLQHEYLTSRAEAEIEKARILKFETELEQCKLELETLIDENKRLLAEAEELKSHRDRLIASEPYKEYERLESEKTGLTSEHKNLQETMKKATLEVRAEVFQWLEYCDTLEKASWSSHPSVKKLVESSSSFLDCLRPLEKISTDDFGQLDLSLFTHAHEALLRQKELLSDICYELDRALIQGNIELDGCQVALRELEKGNKAYPEQFLKSRAALSAKLASESREIPMHPLADLLEITDPAWQKAVEGYLNTQRFLLVVEPKYYINTLRAYNKIKREFPGYGLVDVDKARKGNNVRLPNSLATKVAPTNPLVTEFINYLLGRVICCSSVDDLRRFNTSITADGMRYQGYVSAAIPQRIMDDVYIGKRALEQQIKAKKDIIGELNQDLKTLNNAYAVLIKQKKTEIRMSGYYISDTISAMPGHYSRCKAIASELDSISTKMDELGRSGFFGIVEQKQAIDKRIAENQKERDYCIGTMSLKEDRIKKLTYEELPDRCQSLINLEDRIADSFPALFISDTGEPRYREELARLKSAKSIQKNFGDRLEQTKKSYDESRKALVYARRDYVNEFPPCSYQPDSMLNDDFDRELELLEQIELPKYKEKITAARESALEQFKNDFIAKLTSQIKAVEDQVKELNKALRQMQFGADKYRFIVEKSPENADYYTMIMDPDWMESNEGLFSISLQNRYGALIEELFHKIVKSDDGELNARKLSELQKNIEEYTDYRTYLHFDLETTDQNGNSEYLSNTLKTKSGGETQTPFYIAVLASFAQVYKTHDRSSFGNTMRLVIFDEAFNKMDSERIVECIRLLRKMGLQALFSTPPDKLPDIMPEVDMTYLAYHDKGHYRMHIAPWTKEMEDRVLELQ